MAVVPPPWEELTSDDIAKRLSAFSALSPPTDVRSCYTPHAVYSTGSAVIDGMLPDGGVACGTVMEIVGPPAVGKSALVRRMVAAFAARAAMEWTPAACCSNDDCDQQEEEQQEGGDDYDKEEEEEQRDVEGGIDACSPCDWCVFLVVSDPSSHSPRHICELLRKALASASARGLGCCCCPCSNHDHHDTNPTGCFHLLLEKVKMVTFTSPNDLLMFFRYLSRVEFAAVNPHHHRRRRRVLVVVDSVTRLWEHPACGATAHARHWMAAELVREVRTAVAVGNGWRHPPCETARRREGDPAVASTPNSHGVSSGGVAIVFVNGCKNMYQKTVTSTAAERRPLGVFVWCAAAADLRLFVEPITASDACMLNGRSNRDVSERESSRHDGQMMMMMKVSLVKGGGSVASAAAVAIDNFAAV